MVDKNPFESACSVLAVLRQRHCSLQAAVFGRNSTVPVQQRKRVFALCCESLKYKSAIDALLDASQLMKHSRKLSRDLVALLVYNLLFADGLLHGASTAQKNLILSHKSTLKAELVRLKIKRKVASNADLVDDIVKNTVVLPRYVRVNTLKSSRDKIIAHLAKENYAVSSDLPSLSSIPLRTIILDPHFPDILIFNPKSSLANHSLTKLGHIILQDKASCFPPYVLNPPLNSVVLDACAAPGNKTTLVSAILRNTGKVYAIDRDVRRVETLKMSVEKAGCENVQIINKSFLDLSPQDFSDVEYIMLDPSCSGSGITRRLDYLHEEEHDDTSERIDKLAEFQLTALLHAFTFPNVKKVVYSTCSIHKQENEDVVESALVQSNGKFKLAENVMPFWMRRGENGMTQVVRTVDKEDYVIGFFVALFERC